MTLEVFSRTDQALRDTIINKLSTNQLYDALGNVAEFYGIEWPSQMGQKPWRDGLSAAALGPRGTPGVTLEFLKAALQTYNVPLTVSINPAEPLKLSATGGHKFTHDDISRWVTIDDTLYYVDGPEDVVSAPVSGNYVTLAPVKTAYWAAPNFSTLGGVTEKTATWIPFIFTEPTPGRTHAPDLKNELACKVIIWFVSTISNVPPTYMQGGDAWILFKDQVGAFEIGDDVLAINSQAMGKISYIADKGSYGALLLSNVQGQFDSDGDSLTVLESGVWNDKAKLVGSQGTYYVEYDNGLAPFLYPKDITGAGNTKATCTAAVDAGDGTGILVASTRLTGQEMTTDIHWDNDETIIQSGGEKAKANGAGLSLGSLPRPAGEPYGGQVQENEIKVGKSDVQGGPHPPYLIGDTVLAEVADRLDLLLAAGCDALMKTPT